ncbi:MAG: hypothetical protein ACK4GO_09400 [Gemmobacter sp.]
MSLYSQDRHKRAAKMLGFALTADDAAIWNDAGIVWATRLTTPELMALAFTVLSQLEPEAREMAFEAAHWGIVA